MKKAIITKKELMSLDSALNMIHKEHLLVNLLEKKGLTAIKVGRLRKFLAGKVTRSTLEDGSVEFIQYEGRQTGRTSKQMLNCVGGSLYFWAGSNLEYPIQLSEKLKRIDLQIYSISYLDKADKWRGIDVYGVEVDHYAEELLGERDRTVLEYLKSKLGRETP